MSLTHEGPPLVVGDPRRMLKLTDYGVFENSPQRPVPQAGNGARRKLLVSRYHALGPYPLWHFLRAIEAGAPIWRTIEEYAALDADFIKIYGGDEFPPSVHSIGGGAG